MHDGPDPHTGIDHPIHLKTCHLWGGTGQGAQQPFSIRPITKFICNRPSMAVVPTWLARPAKGADAQLPLPPLNSEDVSNLW